MLIIDKKALKQMLEVSCSILAKNFFYEAATIKAFLNKFSNHVGGKLELFELTADQEILDELRHDETARLYFTCYFVSAHLRDLFLTELHFTEQELRAFEGFLPKYIGEANYEKQQPKSERQGTYYRKFFE
jgi:hypothetical protein